MMFSSFLRPGIALLLGVFSFVSSNRAFALAPNDYSAEGLGLTAVALPQIPDRQVDIRHFGALGDGVTLNTTAFAAAIAEVANKGGGRVVVPPGIWLTGPIIMRSRVELNLRAGALILFSPDRRLYPLVNTSWEGKAAVRCLSPLSGANLEDVAITGKGVIDGSGQAWRPVKKDKLTESQWRRLLASGGVTDDAKRLWFPTESARLGYTNSALRDSAAVADQEKVRDALRPVLLNLVNCKRVLLEGVSFQNSPAWCLHPMLSEDLTLRGLTVRNPWYAQNGDGLDLESCNRVLVEDCSFDVGDDAICLKSGKNEEGRLRGRATENVHIRDCVVYHGHGGFVIGSEMSGGVRNVLIERCTFLGTDIGLRFKSARGRGGVVERIRVSDIRMLNIPGDAVLFDLFYMGRKASGEERIPPVSPETPCFRDISMNRLVSVGSRRAAFFQGLPEMPLQDILLENSSFSADLGIEILDTKGLRLDHVEVQANFSAALVLTDNTDLSASKLELKGTSLVHVKGERTRGIQLSRITGLEAEGALRIDEGASAENVLKR